MNFDALVARVRLEASSAAARTGGINPDGTPVCAAGNDAAWRAAVQAVLDEVRQCVPGPRVRLRDSAQEAEHGFDQCRAEMLRRLNELERK